LDSFFKNKLILNYSKDKNDVLHITHNLRMCYLLKRIIHKQRTKACKHRDRNSECIVFSYVSD